MQSAGSTMPPYDFRQRYGDEIADIVASHSVPSLLQAGRPASHQIKAALQALVADPAAADLQRADALTRALLMEPAWRRLRVQSLSLLTAKQLAECAQYALDHFPPGRKPMVERAELGMALALLAAARTWHAARRHNLLRDALSLVFEADYARVTAIIRTAHRALHAEAESIRGGGRRAARDASPRRAISA